jgi:hypothetical protein
MKTLLILLLLVAVAAGAFLSKPTDKDFEAFVRQHYETNSSKDVPDVKEGAKGMWGKIKDAVKGEMKGLSIDLKVKAFMQGVVFHDRVLWIDVEKDGKIIFTGVFSKWFERDAADWDVKPIPAVP